MAEQRLLDCCSSLEKREARSNHVKRPRSPDAAASDISTKTNKSEKVCLCVKERERERERDGGGGRSKLVTAPEKLIVTTIVYHALFLSPLEEKLITEKRFSFLLARDENDEE